MWMCVVGLLSAEKKRDQAAPVRLVHYPLQQSKPGRATR